MMNMYCILIDDECVPRGRDCGECILSYDELEKDYEYELREGNVQMTYKSLIENPKDGTYRVKAFDRYVYIEGNKIMHIPPNCSIRDDEELEGV